MVTCRTVLNEMVTLEKDMLDGVAGSAIGAIGTITSSGAEGVGVVRLKGVFSDDLEGGTLKVTGKGRKYTLDPGMEVDGGTVPERGESTTGIGEGKTLMVCRPLVVHEEFGRFREDGGEGSVIGLFPEVSPRVGENF